MDLTRDAARGADARQRDPWADALAGLRGLPRLRLAHLPTPLEQMPRLGARLGLALLWGKRDDCGGPPSGITERAFVRAPR